MHVVVVSQLRQCYSLNPEFVLNPRSTWEKYQLSILFGQPLPNFCKFGYGVAGIIGHDHCFPKRSCKPQVVGHPSGRPGMCRWFDHNEWRQVPTSHVVFWNFHRKRNVYACHCSLLQAPYTLVPGDIPHQVMFGRSEKIEENV